MAGLPRASSFKKSDVKRAIDAAREAGLDPASVEIGANGAIRVLSARAVPASAGDEFAAWEARL